METTTKSYRETIVELLGIEKTQEVVTWINQGGSICCRAEMYQSDMCSACGANGLKFK